MATDTGGDTPGQAKDTFDVEQILYYSIPGGLFVILSVITGVILNVRLSFDAALFTAALLTSVPAGYTVYQAYHSNALWVYKRLVWRFPYDPAIEKLKSLLNPNYDAKQQENYDAATASAQPLDRTAHRVLDSIMETEGSVYSIRVRNIVNSKGACLFVSLVGLILPFVGIAYFGIVSATSNVAFPALNIPLLSGYVLFVLILTVIFYTDNARLISNRANYNEVLLANSLEQVQKLAGKLSTLFPESIATKPEQEQR